MVYSRHIYRYLLVNTDHYKATKKNCSVTILHMMKIISPSCASFCSHVFCRSQHKVFFFSAHKMERLVCRTWSKVDYFWGESFAVPGGTCHILPRIQEVPSRKTKTIKQFSGRPWHAKTKNFLRNFQWKIQLLQAKTIGTISFHTVLLLQAIAINDRR